MKDMGTLTKKQQDNLEHELKIVCHGCFEIEYDEWACWILGAGEEMGRVVRTINDLYSEQLGNRGKETLIGINQISCLQDFDSLLRQFEIWGVKSITDFHGERNPL